MKVTVFGATGGIGGHVTRQALEHGWAVTAVVRDPARLEVRHSMLDVAAAPDLKDPATVRPLLRGSDVVLSGVGPRGRKDGPVASTATRTILAAMQTEGVRRLITVSAVPVGPVPVGESFLNRRLILPGIGALLRDVYADLRAMEQAMAESDTDWTVVRPPKLVDKPLTGRYRTAVGSNVPRGYTISKADVAHSMIAAINDSTTIRRAIGVAY
ncbi:NAD(P)H-binding protein [Micromonospora sp. CPCC 205539]|uniref:NAD(P)-dependent oxidoreductase n=1 Tax=Micromonospora sp. CPCC 205539 TaxID=3122408 RepID=UPI002FEE8F89